MRVGEIVGQARVPCAHGRKLGGVLEVSDHVHVVESARAGRDAPDMVKLDIKLESVGAVHPREGVVAEHLEI